MPSSGTLPTQLQVQLTMGGQTTGWVNFNASGYQLGMTYYLAVPAASALRRQRARLFRAATRRRR